MVFKQSGVKVMKTYRFYMSSIKVGQFLLKKTIGFFIKIVISKVGKGRGNRQTHTRINGLGRWGRWLFGGFGGRGGGGGCGRWWW